MPSSYNRSSVGDMISKSDDATLTIYGKNGLYSPSDLEFEPVDQLEEMRRQIITAGRPTNFINSMLMATTYYQPYLLMDYYMREVSILATIRSRSVKEIFRYGIDWQPKFAKKCSQCGMEYQENAKRCDRCGNEIMISPEERQKDYFVRPNGRSFLKEANDSGQSLKSVLQQYAESQYQNNQAYLGCISGDVVDSEGTIEKQYPLEFVTYDPKFVKKLFDESAVLGGEMGFVAEDRMRGFYMSAYPTQVTEDGLKVIPAFYKVGRDFGATGECWYYSKDEIFCDNWFGQTQTYGVPPWMDIEDDILSYHFIEKHQLKRWQYGYVRGLLVFPGFNRNSMENLAKSIQKVLAKNDNSIPMIALPPAVPGAGEQKVQFVSLTNDSAGDLMTYKNDIRDRLCARVGVPNLIVTDTESSGGLNSESQQITVFDRYLMDMYDHVDDMLEWIISTWFTKITDWKLTVTRPPKMNSELKEKQEEVQYALSMKNLGFPPLSQKNGKFEFPEFPNNPNQNPMGGMMGGMMGGGLPPSFR